MRLFKKMLVFMIVISIMCFTSCDMLNGTASSETESNEKDASALKTVEEIEEADPGCLKYLSYVFYTHNEMWYVSRLSDDYKTVSYTISFNKKSTTIYDILDLKTDTRTDVYDVVKELGLPIESGTFGMISMLFKTNDGAEAAVYFTQDKESNEMYVSGVHFDIDTIDFTGMKYSDVKLILGSEGRDVGSGVVIMQWKLDNKKSLRIWLTNYDSNSLDNATVSKYVIE